MLLEYPIPRRQKRLDAVLLASDVIFCLEFKTRDKTHSLQSQRQVEDYALDLHDFHEASRDRHIIPVVVVPGADSSKRANEPPVSADAVRSVRLANSKDLAETIFSSFDAQHSGTSAPIDPVAWDKSRYCPIPTIIEAAEALYAGHDVSEITHSHAGATNLTVTSDRLIEIISEAQEQSQKVICFVTGVPGAGKTLAGLNVVHNPGATEQRSPSR